MRILDAELVRDLIHQRQEQGLDKYDEVWEGTYVVPPMANNPHQILVAQLTVIFHEIVVVPGKGFVLPGANVSDRLSGWETNYREPDVVVVLHGSRAIDCGTHWVGGPDFLVEIQSPGDATEEKIPFYSALGVRELLVIQGDSRALGLFRQDGQNLLPVNQTLFEGKKWLCSQVLPLAFARAVVRSQPLTLLTRTDGTPAKWTI
jgi:Uma2 family endonuclease